MSRSLRLSEKWFHRGLWLVAFVFASFLIGLGGTIVENLPKVERNYSLDDFIDQRLAQQARDTAKAAQNAGKDAQEALDQTELKARVAQSDYRSARESFNNWLATRHATARSDQDPELISRTKALDALKTTERQTLSHVQAQQQAALDARQTQARAQAQLRELEQAAETELRTAQRSQDLRVFLYRLALTLPLLVIAGWLFAKKRKGTYWPFVWGFIFFALFAFFVELVPYLPSYGGYVRYAVGIVITILVGRQAIVSLNRYLERQKLAEQKPDLERREELSYDVALARLAKSVCPGCERSVDLKDPANDFCPHCGIGLHDHCVKCDARKGSFAKFCHACGTVAGARTKAAV
ncbi:MAG: serine endopeptidase [Burkholderiales bacterium RIFCSPLOWO2_02_FULL_57_36]|nr:MAG: serine endopeptidase [Burkholderiales bacterium RIFCSPLOWO2_02_FULL_57_36]